MRGLGMHKLYVRMAVTIGETALTIKEPVDYTLKYREVLENRGVGVVVPFEKANLSCTFGLAPTAMWEWSCWGAEKQGRKALGPQTKCLAFREAKCLTLRNGQPGCRKEAVPVFYLGKTKKI